jgi:hypothetical protein
MTELTDYTKEYYYLERDGNPNFPLLGVESGEDSEEIIDAEEWIDREEAFRLCFGDPVPRKPKMADYHSLPESVVSEKIKLVFDELNIPYVQLFPSTIRNTKTDEVVEGYYFIKIFNQIKCMDREKSKWDAARWNPEVVVDIDKLVLNNEILDKIPLEERLVFAIDNAAHELFHRSVVEKIMASNPTGLKPYPVCGWDPSAPFKDEYWAAMLGDDE